MAVVVVVALILCGLANNRADARTSCSADDSSLKAAAEDRTESRATGPADQRAFARTDSTLIPPVIIMVGTVVVVVVAVAAASAVAHAIVVGAVVMVLREPGYDRGCEEKRSDEDRFSKLAHLHSDAELEKRGLSIPANS
jgi:hypothetical protein